jgi:hypothetical protein
VKVNLICKLCGAEFSVRPYRALTAKFCSALCRNRGNGKFNADKIGNTRRGRGAGRGYIKFHGRHLHRIVAEIKIGRPLRPGEIVHHKDENKRNNSDKNLDVTTQSKHIEMHRKKMNDRRWPS